MAVARILLFIVGSLILPLGGKAERPQTVTSLLAVGYPGGWAFAAGRRYFTDSTASFTVSRSGGTVDIEAGDYSFRFDRNTPEGPIQAGVYDLYEYRDLSMSMSKGSAAARAYWGTLEVHEAVYDLEGQPLHFWATFDIYDEAANRMAGEIRYNARVGLHVEAPSAKLLQPGVTFTLPIWAVDSNGNQPLQLTASALPDGASFSDAGDGTGLLTWTPAAADAGVHDVEFQVTNNAGESKKRTTRLVVEGRKILLLESDYGNGGKPVRISAPGAHTFEVSSNPYAGVSFVLKQSETDTERQVHFGAPYDELLTEGQFDDARYYPSHRLNHGLAIWPVTTSDSYGNFIVHKMAIDDDGKPIAFAATFQQWSGGSIGSTRGYVEYNVQPDPIDLPFIKPPADFGVYAGNYVGTILPPIPDKGASGLVNISLNRLGRFSGRLRLGSRSIPIRGEFLEDGWASVQVGSSFVYLAILETGEIAVQVDEPSGAWGLGRMARRAARESVAGAVGDYTMILGTPGILPQVAYNGWGTVKVSRSGAVRGIFRTAANKSPTVSAGGFLDSAQTWSFRSSTFAAGEPPQAIVGDVRFVASEIADFDGEAFWFSRTKIGATTDRRSMRTSIFGSRFSQGTAPFPEDAELNLTVVGPDAQPLAVSIYEEPLRIVRSRTRIDCTGLDGQVTLRIDLRSGTVRGIGDSVLGPMSFQGIVFQHGSFAAGLLGIQRHPFVIEVAQQD